MEKLIVPNEGRGANNKPIKVIAEREEDFPLTITRLGCVKFQYLVKSVAQICKGQKVLELFGGTNLGTSIIAETTKAKNITTLDIHYNGISSTNRWYYSFRYNYRLHWLHSTNVGQPGSAKEEPIFVAGNATRLGFPEDSFDVTLIADSPRNGWHFASDALGRPADMDLFLSSFREATKVTKPGGCYCWHCSRMLGVTFVWCEVH